MTRINTIPPRQLSDELVVNELGELPRVFLFIIESLENGRDIDVPVHYRLGEGHVKFFYNKASYLYRRYMQLRHEYYKRFSKAYSTSHLKEVNKRVQRIIALNSRLFNNWEPDFDALEACRERICSKVDNYARSHHYMGVELTVDGYKALINVKN